MSDYEKAPDRIWLQHYGRDYRDGWSWCWHEIGEAELDETEYVRADLQPSEPVADGGLLDAIRHWLEKYGDRTDKTIGEIGAERLLRGCLYLNPPSREPEGMTHATRWDLHLADEHGDITVRKFDPAKDKAIPVWIGAAPPESREREAMEGVTAYQCTNGDLYILTNANLVGAVHHFYQPFPEHAEQFGPLKTLTILEGAEDE